ncbi:MAG TPA: phosphoglucosamine mutase [Nitrosopumilaceae archaeon]|nr:phosphoglucosamine mutase [Nitrosopumilaceae archaeon]
MTKLFGTNGIRGVFGQDFTLEFIHDITLCLAEYFKEGPILVGYDGRDTSPIIAKIICSTLNYAGLDCKNAGLNPTPCLEYATKKLGYRGGIMITASHNPPQYNGIKPVAGDGVEISREDEKLIEDIYFEKKWKNNSSKFGSTKEETSVIQEYFDGIKSHVDSSKIIEQKFKVVLDLGNGAQAVTASKLCEELGCQVTTINETIDGSFPGRGSEPTPENLSELSDTVKKIKADFGIAFDGDGDRSLFCDNNGIILTGDKSALLFSKYILEKNPNATIVTCLNSGSSIEKIAASSNAKVIRTKVGSVEVSRKMVPINALIGFEENGGFMFGKHNQVRDGAMTMVLALDILAKTNKTMSELIDDLPPSFTTKTKITCSKEDIQKIIHKLKEEYPDSDTTDGIKITFDEGNWVMVRPSGTEPIIRVYAEGSSKEKLDNLISEHVKKIKSILDR